MIFIIIGMLVVAFLMRKSLRILWLRRNHQKDASRFPGWMTYYYWDDNRDDQG